MIMTSRPPHELLDILDTWVDAQSEQRACDPDQFLRREPNTVILRVLVSAGAKFRTSCDLPAEECESVNKLLKKTWEAAQEEVAKSLPGESYKWWEGVLLIGNSSLETKKNRRTKLLGMNTDYQSTWLEWRSRNLDRGYRKLYTVGIAFGVPHGVWWKDTAGYGQRPKLGHQ